MNDKYYNTGKKDFMKKWMKTGLIDLWTYALLDFFGFMLFFGPFIHIEIYNLLNTSSDIVLVSYLMGTLTFIISSLLTDQWFKKIFQILERDDYMTHDISRKNIYKVKKNGNDIIHTP